MFKALDPFVGYRMLAVAAWLFGATCVALAVLTR